MASRGTGSDFGGIDTSDRDPRARAKKGKAGKPKSPPRRRSGGFRAGPLRWVRLGAAVVAGAGVLGLAAVIGLFVYYGSDPNMPSLDKLSAWQPPQMTRVLDREGKQIGSLGAQRRTVVPIEKIPKVLQQAAVAAEDAEFYHHKGVDYVGLLRAFVNNILRGKFAQGASTITQQVVRGPGMLLSQEKTLRRKVQEIILARQISSKLSKDQILEIYLNQSYFGHGIYGCEEASRFFFAKSVTDVDVGEAALLAGMLQKNVLQSPYRHPEAAKARQKYVLGQMAKLGFIDAATERRFADKSITVVPETTLARPSGAPEATDTVRRVLADRYGAQRLSTLGITVKTSVDGRLQELARQALERGLEEVDARLGYRGPSGHLQGKTLERHRAALIADRKKGDLKGGEIVEAIVDRVERVPGDKKGGTLFIDVGGFKGVVDLAAEKRYAAGPKALVDRFKPGDLVRVRAAPDRLKGPGKEPALALELGPQGAIVMMDPRTREILALVGGYAFRAGGFDRSQRALRQAGSAFKPFVYAAAIDSGRFTAASVLNDAPIVYDKWKPRNYDGGFKGPVRLRTALAESINTVAVNLLAEVGLPAAHEMAVKAGLSTPMPEDLNLAMALGANSVSPLELANAYATFASGGLRAQPRIVVAAGDEPMEYPEPEATIRPETAYVVTSMMRSVTEEGTAKAVASRLRRPVAGKTGTTSGEKDLWFVGYTPDLLTAVWLGFDDGKSLGRRESGGRTVVPIWLDLMTKALANRPVQVFKQPPTVVVTRIDPATGLLPPPGVEGIEEVFIEGTAPTQTAAAQGEENSADKLLFEN